MKFKRMVLMTTILLVVGIAGCEGFYNLRDPETGQYYEGAPITP